MATATVYLTALKAALLSPDRPCNRAPYPLDRGRAAVKCRPPQSPSLGRLHTLSMRCFVSSVNLVLDNIAQPSPGRLFLCSRSAQPLLDGCC